MTQTPPVDPGSPIVATHLTMLQAVIQRMAGNSASCKTWCVTIVAGILVFMGDKEKPAFAYVAGMATLLFGGLDIYYLSLEVAFRSSYDDFVQRLHRGELRTHDAFVIASKPRGASETIRAAMSPSVWPFYLALVAMIILAHQLATPDPQRTSATPVQNVSGAASVVTTTITTTVKGEEPPALPVTAPGTGTDRNPGTPGPLTEGASAQNPTPMPP